MSIKAEVVTAVGTVGCAFCIGFAMQSGEVADLRYGSASVSTASVSSAALGVAPALKVRDMAFVKSNKLSDIQDFQLASADTTTPAPVVLSDADLLAIDEFAYGAECDVTARVLPLADEMITLLVAAPCFGDEHVTVSLNDVERAEKLSSDGLLELVLPAPVESDNVKVAFENGERITALFRM